MSRLFESSKIAKVYVRYRPSPPERVRKLALDYLRSVGGVPDDRGKFQCLVDVGCGSGQATKIFAENFETAIGVDPSGNQIREARESNSLENVDFRVGGAENVPVEDGSADMVIVAQAVHWFDIEKFCCECKRILKPGSGCLVAFGYLTPEIVRVGFENDSELKMKSCRATRKFVESCR